MAAHAVTSPQRDRGCRPGPPAARRARSVRPSARGSTSRQAALRRPRFRPRELRVPASSATRRRSGGLRAWTTLPRRPRGAHVQTRRARARARAGVSRLFLAVFATPSARLRSAVQTTFREASRRHGGQRECGALPSAPGEERLCPEEPAWVSVSPPAWHPPRALPPSLALTAPWALGCSGVDTAPAWPGLPQMAWHPHAAGGGPQGVSQSPPPQFGRWVPGTGTAPAPADTPSPEGAGRLCSAWRLLRSRYSVHRTNLLWAGGRLAKPVGRVEQGHYPVKDRVLAGRCPGWVGAGLAAAGPHQGASRDGSEVGGAARVMRVGGETGSERRTAGPRRAGFSPAWSVPEPAAGWGQRALHGAYGRAGDRNVTGADPSRRDTFSVLITF